MNMSIDFNNSLESAFYNLKNTIAEAYELVSKIWDEDPCRAHVENRNQLEALLREACLRIEILNSYNFTYDRFERHCYGYHPGRYEVQCKLCEVEQSCAEKAKTTGQIGRTPPPQPYPWSASDAIKPPYYEPDADVGQNNDIAENCCGASDD
jgi:hypothetical protein